jgi:peptide/nickel transport system substrate-binding protein
VFRRSVISICLIVVSAITPSHARTRPHYGGTLRIETADDAWQGTDAIARKFVFDGLTALDKNGVVQPALAVSWQSDNGGHRWQLRLRNGVRFHDGSPLTAATVVQSLSTSCGSNCPWSAVRAVGSSLIFNSDSPLPNLPDLLASDIFLVSSTRTASPSSPAQPIGTGFFQISQSSGNTVVLTPNDSCWQGRPFLDQITITSHRAVRDQWLDLTLGRADIVEVPAEHLKQAEQQHLTVITSKPVSLLALELSDSGTLSNQNLRNAIALSVDRSAIHNVIYQKQGQITASLVPDSASGYGFLFPIDRDLNKASQARGRLNAGAVGLSAVGDGVMQLTAQRLALNLREVGFIVRIDPPGSTRYSDILLRTLPVAGSDSAGVLARLLLFAGQPPAAPQGQDPQSLYHSEKDILNSRLIVPLIDLARSYAISGRVHNFALRADGTPEFADVSVESAP